MSQWPSSMGSRNVDKPLYKPMIIHLGTQLWGSRSGWQYLVIWSKLRTQICISTCTKKTREFWWIWWIARWSQNPGYCWHICLTPDSKVHGANMGPIWGQQDPGGPHELYWDRIHNVVQSEWYKSHVKLILDSELGGIEPLVSGQWIAYLLFSVLDGPFNYKHE